MRAGGHTDPSRARGTGSLRHAPAPITRLGGGLDGALFGLRCRQLRHTCAAVAAAVILVVLKARRRPARLALERCRRLDGTLGGGAGVLDAAHLWDHAMVE